MDKFVEEAFEQADKAVLKLSAAAYNAMMLKDGVRIYDACAYVMGEHYDKLIKVINENGLDIELTQPEHSFISSGFYLGFLEGRKSMLEDHV